MQDVVRKERWRPRHQSEVDKRSRYKNEPFENSAVAANQKKLERAALRQKPAGMAIDTPNLASLGRRDPTISDTDWRNRKNELRHLQDPLELARFVKDELRKGKVTEMMQLTRMASHSMNAIVSWNHIIDHLLAKERVGEALKIYNDVSQLQTRRNHDTDYIIDEEARTIPRCVHVHDYPAGSVHQCAHVRRAEQSAFCLPLAVRTEFTSRAVNHTYKCYAASVRQGFGHGCSLGRSCENTGEGTSIGE